MKKKNGKVRAEGNAFVLRNYKTNMQANKQTYDIHTARITQVRLSIFVPISLACSISNACAPQQQPHTYEDEKSSRMHRFAQRGWYGGRYMSSW